MLHSVPDFRKETNSSLLFFLIFICLIGSQLRHAGSSQLQHMGSRSLDLGMKPGAPALGEGSLNLWTTREVPQLHAFRVKSSFLSSRAIYIHLFSLTLLCKEQTITIYNFLPCFQRGKLENSIVWVLFWLKEKKKSSRDTQMWEI